MNFRKNYKYEYFKVNNTKQKISNIIKICNKTSKKLLKKNNYDLSR